MPKYIISLDQGTTSSRCILFDQMCIRDSPQESTSTGRFGTSMSAHRILGLNLSLIHI